MAWHIFGQPALGGIKLANDAWSLLILQKIMNDTSKISSTGGLIAIRFLGRSTAKKPSHQTFRR